ncbi:uncharacterized protein NFIA_080170 [Aspergillus fischeri NRRL 181]|uniref:Uncharacterized protein n=1 Tax=Neosartorya fischeri (strain ATCC 1020 / DSM 3700 / CBS 544.65 / FGSC A1164 / JCM 1740 / NRRL 181 / WB 181) TaxID=331117 RepID=A1DFB8_NEOFI|nr:conserved hypothetical protein [Aspergillus fischeri NRRL 181]EAW18075.1 conserved hypothetical protein [Aspergillus fischeri NRRL 181]KAG2016690.1 hypothetical protein GB937_006169 [Aspergillus fischeri]
METAPLTLAHTHARNAVLETRKANPVAASEEHDLAAGEFATAAQNSSDREALRTLQLLEQHHKKLAQILRFQHENPVSTTSAATAQTGTGESETTKLSPTSPEQAQQQPPRLVGNTRLPARETSSIASNLASARGIPSQPRRASPVSPTVSSQQAGARMTEGPSKLKTGESRLRGTQAHNLRDRPSGVSASKQPWSPPVTSPTEITSQHFVPPETVESGRQKNKTAPSEEPFQRFYSTFEGLISKISAPLAFAGLPLGSEASTQSDSARRKSSAADTKVDRHQATSDRLGQFTEPDVSRIFSRAALRAIRDSNGNGAGNTAESFYVVPTTGGTVSYAGILTRAEKEARRNSLDEADDDFVDARETPASPELRQSLTGSRGRASRAADKLTSLHNPKTMEELQMENQALKHLSDTLSKRLHMWEVNAQSSSMALQQSLKAMHHHNGPWPDHPYGAQGSSAAVSPSAAMDSDQRIKELEERMRRNEKELERVRRENEKLRDVLGRYRERWEKLKEGAKTRRAEGRVAAGSSTADTVKSGDKPGTTPSADSNTQEQAESAKSKSDGDTENESTGPEAKGDASDS